ncbi:MAG: polysaccharide biosynthesis/export family protein [Polyangiaceae bacterium]
MNGGSARGTNTRVHPGSNSLALIGKGWVSASLVSLSLSVSACGGVCPPPPKNLPAPTFTTSLGVGDVFEVLVVGEEKLPKEYRVAPDGTIDFPYIKRLQVNGLDPQEVQARIRLALQEGKILSDPQVSVFVKQYNSKKVNMLGQVMKPGPLPYVDGMKLVDAISQVGGFTALADTREVVIIRTIGPGKTVTAVVCVEAITDGKQPDILLQAGDIVKISQRVI